MKIYEYPTEPWVKRLIFTILFYTIKDTLKRTKKKIFGICWIVAHYEGKIVQTHTVLG